MSDQKKPTDSGSTESAATEEPGKELDADQLENVAGGLLPAVSVGVIQHKWAPDSVKIEIASHKVIGEDGISLKK
jgi:hypothetical protein